MARDDARRQNADTKRRAGEQRADKRMLKEYCRPAPRSTSQTAARR